MAPHEPQDGLSNEEIKVIVMEIVGSPHNEAWKTEEYKKLYPDFAERYPVLFSMACSPTFDESRFIYMMNLRQQVLSRKRTLEDTSKEVGEVLFNKYVKPNISEAK